MAGGLGGFNLVSGQYDYGAGGGVYNVPGTQGSSWLDVIRTGLQVAPQILGYGEGGGGGGIFGPSVQEPGSMVDVNVCPTMFRAGNQANIRPLPLLSAINPGTGMLTYWRHVGRPILFAGDARLARRIEKTCRRAMRGRARGFR
jgi:hypothetical protein